MGKSIEYRITPLVLTGFMGMYNVESKHVVKEYARYLEDNKSKHHYQGLRRDQWYEAEVQTYINNLIARVKEVEDSKPDEFEQCAAWAN